jgi:hypothetical protein
MTVPTNEFSRETSGLPAASATPTVELSEGDRFALRIAPVSKQIGDATVRMLAYNDSIPGPTLRVVQGSEVLSGRCEREEFVEDVVLAPSERAVVDVRFETPGQLTLEHRTPGRTYTLAKIAVAEGAAAPSLATEFEILRTDPELTAERERLTPLLDEPPDKTLAFVAEMDMGEPDVGVGGEVVYACPMHPEVVLEVTNVGRWMAHCHIAEHHKSGMMFSFDVTP